MRFQPTSYKLNSETPTLLYANDLQLVNFQPLYLLNRLSLSLETSPHLTKLTALTPMVIQQA